MSRQAGAQRWLTGGYYGHKSHPRQRGVRRMQPEGVTASHLDVDLPCSSVHLGLVV